MWRSLRAGLREWKRDKFFGFAVLVLLSIGVGANTLMFSFVNTLLLKPLPVRNPQDLVLIEKVRIKQVRPDTSFFYRQFEALNQLKKIFPAAVAEQEWTGVSFQRFSTGDSMRLLTTQIVSPNYFSELGVRSVVGRVLVEGDATATGEIPVVLSYQFWHAQFGGKRDVLGEAIRIHDYPFRVVGILPEDFHSFDVDRAPDVRLPISAAPILHSGSVQDPRGQTPIQFKIIARMSKNVPLAAGRTAVLQTLKAMEPTLWREWWTRTSPSYPIETLQQRIAYEENYRIDLPSVSRGIFRLRDQFAKAALLLMGGTGILMLGVCITVGGLYFSKAQRRKGEIAIRLAMGAGRLTLLRMLLAEQLWIILPSVSVGLALAYLAAPVLVEMLPGPRGLVQLAATPQIMNVAPDPAALLFASGLSIVSVVTFGFAPFWRLTALNLADTLKSSGHDRITRASEARAAIAMGIAIAIMLGTGAVAMVRTFWKLDHLNPGFDRSHVVEFTIDPELAGYSSSRIGSFRRELRQRIGQLPGVRATSYAHMGIMRGLGTKTTVVPSGRVLPDRTFLNTNTNSVSRDYFETLGIPLLTGSPLREEDESRHPTPIIVNQAFASEFFPYEGNVVGKSIVEGTDGRKSPTAIIVGVVGTAKYRSLREVDPPIYYSASSDSDAGQYLYVRTVGDPAATIKNVWSVLRDLDSRVPLIEAFTLEQEVQTSLWQERILSVIAMFFGGVALSLAATGLFATLAYSVEQRRREIGIRTAVGAQFTNIVWTLCARLVAPLGMGVAIGVLGSTLILRNAQALLFGIGSFDPVSISVACGLLLLTATAATTGPIIRANRVNPAIILRES